MVDLVAFLAAIGPLAILITKLVDFIRNFDKGDTWWKGTWIVLALVFGVIYAMLTGANFVALIEGLRPEVTNALSSTAGELVTGLAIGAMACFWHEPLSSWGMKAGPNAVTDGSGSTEG